jgi:hypothetical protein
VLNAFRFVDRATADSAEASKEPKTREERLAKIMETDDHAAVRTEITLTFLAKASNTPGGRSRGAIVTHRLLETMVDATLSMDPSLLDELNISEIEADRMAYSVKDTGRAMKRRVQKALDEQSPPAAPSARKAPKASSKPKSTKAAGTKSKPTKTAAEKRAAALKKNRARGV